MSLFESLLLFSETGDKIDSLWEFFVTVHLALFAAIFALHKLKKHQSAIMLISYIAFSLINIRAKLNEYAFYGSLISDIKSSSAERSTEVLSFIGEYSVTDREMITIGIHIMAFVFILIILAMKPKQ